jgi:hypothetical protein
MGRAAEVARPSVYRRSEVATMAKLKRRKPKKPRCLVVLGMILTRKAKSWDARERRAKDARRNPVKEGW